MNTFITLRIPPGADGKLREILTLPRPSGLMLGLAGA